MELMISTADVSAVIFWKDKVFIGIGQSVHVFNCERKKLLSKSIILNRYKIRDFSCSSTDLILAYGGKEIGIFKLLKESSQHSIGLIATWKSEDWIVHSKWVDSDEKVATLSSHNVVTFWSVKEHQKLWQVSCEEQNILYTGFLFGNSSVDLVCFAGSVFGQVAIWSVHQKQLEKDVENEKPILHYLRGHKGAVFSIFYNEESRLICTTSDDRSVQWWQVAFTLGEVDNGILPSLLDLWSSAKICRRSTCFGHLARVWKCLSFRTLTFTIGEDSQICVWKHLKVKDSGVDPRVDVVQFPLLARKQVLRGGSIWNLDFSSDYGLALGLEDGGLLLCRLSTLLCSSFVSSHNPLEGKNDPTRRVCLYGQELQPLVITKNGALAVAMGLECDSPCWKHIFEDQKYIGLGLLEPNNNRKSIAVSATNNTFFVLSGNSKLCGNEDVTSVVKVSLTEDCLLSAHWLTDDLLLTCGSDGKLLLWLLLQKDGKETIEQIGSWVLPYSKQRWTTAASWIPYGEAPGLILCGNRSGDLLVYSGACAEPVQILHNVHGHMGITSFMVSWANTNGLSFKERNCCTTSYHNVYLDSNHPHLESIYKLAYDAMIYSTGRNGLLNLYVIRNGRLRIKKNEKLGFEWAARCFMINERVFVFGFKGASAVLWGLQERTALLEKNCGGGHRSWDLDFITHIDGFSMLRLALVKNGHLSLINWRIPSQDLSGNMIREGLHSKDVNCVKCLSLPELHSKEYLNHPILIISGSEDTTVKVSSFTRSCNGESPALSTISTLHGHLSSVRTLFVIPLSCHRNIQCGYDKSSVSFQETEQLEQVGIEKEIQSMDFMIFTAGGRAQMKAWKLSFDQPEHEGLSMDMSLEYFRVEELSSILLGAKKQGKKEVQNDPEARFMDICAFFPVNNKGNCVKPRDSCTLIAVIAACSDGYVRLLGYREHQNITKEILGMSHFLCVWSKGVPHPPPTKHHCLFRACHRLLCGQHLLITTDSVGYFHLWDVTSHVNSMRNKLENCDLAKGFVQAASVNYAGEKLSPFYCQLVHQFSINALDWLELSGNSSNDQDVNSDLSSLILVASGGEDGTLALNLLKLSRKCDNEPWDQVIVQLSWCNEFVMKTQISGLKFIQNGYLVTVSKGQQVTLWQWRCNVEESILSASIISEHFSAVADIQDIDVVRTRDGFSISVCGSGLEILHLPTLEEKEQ